MLTTAPSVEAAAAPRWAAKGDWLRIGLVPLAVVTCHQFGWHAWRAWNCSVFLAIARVAQIPAVRVSYDTFASGAHLYRFELACTALDAFLGSLPLLWETRRSTAANVSFLAAYFAVLSAANMFRLTFGMLLYGWGVPWRLSHEALAGVCYFLLFLWIVRRRGWR